MNLKEALAKPPVCASGGFRVRGSGGVFDLNPGILNPDFPRFQGFFKRLIVKKWEREKRELTFTPPPHNGCQYCGLFHAIRK